MEVPRANDLVPRFEDWLQTVGGWRQARVERFHRVEGGASNLTYRVGLAGGPRADVVLRLQRDRGIFEPYDVLREARVLVALRRTAIPVPEVLFVEASSSALGAPFAVLEWIDAPHMGAAGPEADFRAYVAMVARVHTLDWRGAGLEFLAAHQSPEAALRAALEAVRRRAAGWGCAADPSVARGFEILSRSLPGGGTLGLCQGDINVFNYLFRGGRVVGVVDWEQAAIADPRLDIGQLLALAHLKGAPWTDPRSTPFVREYEATVGHPVLGLEWFRAFWLWQLLVIHRGWELFTGGEPWYGRSQAAAALDRALQEVSA
jgi:aminoglycoside phosphotransferase (APT) family kinase protein